MRERLEPEEVEEEFEHWLFNLDGEVHADVMAEVWNRLADKFDWPERMEVVE